MRTVSPRTGPAPRFLRRTWRRRHHRTTSHATAALKLDVPDDAIYLDEAGVNTDATVRNTTALFRDRHIHRVLAVSHSYHLAWIKMSYLQSGWNVYTIPAREDCGLPGHGRFLIVRELAALGAYYLHPLHRG